MTWADNCQSGSSDADMIAGDRGDCRNNGKKIIFGALEWIEESTTGE